MAVEWDYPREPTVNKNVSPEFRDQAYGLCLRCGQDADGFAFPGPAGLTQQRARLHTAQTGHPTRMYAPLVAEFYLAGNDA
jgi:hypothetical protein